MPTYTYRAVTKTGLVVRNKVESASRMNLIRSLKNNGLMPIAIEQVSYRSANRQKKQKKNVTDIQEIMKNVNTTQLGREKNKTLTTKEKVNLYFAKSEKIRFWKKRFIYFSIKPFNLVSPISANSNRFFFLYFT